MGYAEPVGKGTFEAQQNFITELEQQMSSLGISTLFAQRWAQKLQSPSALAVPIPTARSHCF